MEIINHFKKSTELDLTAAQIGLNKWEWIFVESIDLVEASRIMTQNEIDILPYKINGEITKYFKTNEWSSFDKISMLEINHSDTIYYRLSFLDIVKKMIKENRTYYFLSNSDEILGLISIVHFNCLAVYNYLYQIIADLETNLSSFIKSIAEENEIIEILSNSSDKTAKKIVEAYTNLRSKGLNNSIFESLFFPTFSTLIKNLEQKLKHSNREELLQYRKYFNSDQVYGRLRNSIAHPVKPIFESIESLKDVQKLIVDTQKIKSLIQTN